MEEQKEEVTDTKEERKPIHFFRNLLITILVIIGLGYVISYLTNRKEDENYSMKYVSIKNDYLITYLNVEFDLINLGYTQIEFDAKDFSVLKDGMPVQASSISGSHSFGYFYEIYKPNSEDNTIKVKFDYALSSLDSPLTFYYKGKKLEMGEKVFFE